ncbi:MAG: RagB/SusD family nutrient uptake outer membrane protein, partial [Prevotellaceae bacterium]|nr:RagB/SusD family nutrient uptake outer membrane protein [Prevotellaceae bacterium]
MKKYNILLMAVLLMAALSCKDSFLDEEPYSYYGTGYTDAKTIEAQVIGLHRTYAELWGWSDQQGFLSCWHIGTDICSAGATQGVENPFFLYADLNAENA